MLKYTLQNAKQNKLRLLPIRLAPITFLLYTISVLLSTLLIVVIAYSRQLLVNYGTKGILQEFVILIIINLVLMYFSQHGLPTIAALISSKLRNIVIQDTEKSLIFKKASIPYEYHEAAETNDLFEHLEKPYDFIWDYWQALILIIGTTLSIIGMLLYVAQIGFIFSGILTLILIPIMSVSIKAGNSYYDTWARTAEYRRRCSDLRNVLSDKKYAQEKLLFGYQTELLSRWENSYKTVRSDSIKEEIKGARKVSSYGVMLCVVFLLLLIYILHLLRKNQISPGIAVSLITIFPTFVNQVIFTLSNQINILSRAQNQMSAYSMILSLPNEEGIFDLPEYRTSFKCIEFRNVSFRYPGTDNLILHNLSFKIHEGQHYALVGINGAGKTTLIKLLLRLYRVTEGEILIDGKNINDFSRKEIIGLVSALFQDFARYPQTVSENIGIGNIHEISNEQEIIKCAECIDISMRITSLKNGYKTNLSNVLENGVDLSGGEWQKVCIARLLFSKTAIKILDEPTAALDPFGEEALFEDFFQLMKDTTTLTISHRLSSCKYADQILVLDHGCIAESGTHQQLIERDGLYAKMYLSQKEMYH